MAGLVDNHCAGRGHIRYYVAADVHDMAYPTMSDLPFDDLEEEPAPAVPQRLTAIQYAVQQNSDEDWDTCCVCGVSENAAPYGNGLARGLVLLSDGTLARSAWCGALVCSGDKYAAIWLPIDSKEIRR